MEEIIVIGLIAIVVGFVLLGMLEGILFFLVAIPLGLAKIVSTFIGDKNKAKFTPSDIRDYFDESNNWLFLTALIAAPFLCYIFLWPPPPDKEFIRPIILLVLFMLWISIFFFYLTELPKSCFSTKYFIVFVLALFTMSILTLPILLIMGFNITILKLVILLFAIPILYSLSVYISLLILNNFMELD